SVSLSNHKYWTIGQVLKFSMHVCHHCGDSGLANLAPEVRENIDGRVARENGVLVEKLQCRIYPAFTKGLIDLIESCTQVVRHNLFHREALEHHVIIASGESIFCSGGHWIAV